MGHYTITIADMAIMATIPLPLLGAPRPRSNALGGPLWALGIFVSGLVGSPATHSPTWLSICLAAGAAAAFLLFSWGFGYLLIKDRDALRSEGYVLDKMRIERGITGDDRGFTSPVAGTPSVPPTETPASARRRKTYGE